MKKYLLFSFVFCSLLWGCRERDYSNPFEVTDLTENSPTVVSLDGTYTYSINAKNYSLERNDPLVFQNDSLIITIVIDNYKSGTCDASIKNKAGDILFSENSTGNKSVVVLKKLYSIPNSILISQNNLTARVSIVLTAKK